MICNYKKMIFIFHTKFLRIFYRSGINEIKLQIEAYVCKDIKDSQL